MNNVINAHLVGNTVGPCPRCGAMGRIPDGTFNFVNDSVEVIQSADISSDVLRALIDLIKNWADDPQASPETVVKEVSKVAPALAAIMSTLPHNRNEWYGFLMLLVGILTLLLTFKMANQAAPPANQIYEQVINTCGNNPPLPPLIGHEARGHHERETKELPPESPTGPAAP